MPPVTGSGLGECSHPWTVLVAGESGHVAQSELGVLAALWFRATVFPWPVLLGVPAAPWLRVSAFIP